MLNPHASHTQVVSACTQAASTHASGASTHVVVIGHCRMCVRWQHPLTLQCHPSPISVSVCLHVLTGLLASSIMSTCTQGASTCVVVIAHSRMCLCLQHPLRSGMHLWFMPPSACASSQDSVILSSTQESLISASSRRDPERER